MLGHYAIGGAPLAGSRVSLIINQLLTLIGSGALILQGSAWADKDDAADDWSTQSEAGATWTVNTETTDTWEVQ